MSAALFPVLQDSSATLDVAVDGKALARSSDLLDRLAREAGVRPLMEFFDVGEDEYGVLDDAETTPLTTQWHSAHAGLTTVRALLEQVKSLPGSDDALLADLIALEKVLAWADQQQIGWHLAVDM